MPNSSLNALWRPLADAGSVTRWLHTTKTKSNRCDSKIKSSTLKVHWLLETTAAMLLLNDEYWACIIVHYYIILKSNQKKIKKKYVLRATYTVPGVLACWAKSLLIKMKGNRILQHKPPELFSRFITLAWILFNNRQLEPGEKMNAHEFSREHVGPMWDLGAEIRSLFRGGPSWGRFSKMKVKCFSNSKFLWKYVFCKMLMYLERRYCELYKRWIWRSSRGSYGRDEFRLWVEV